MTALQLDLFAAPPPNLLTEREAQRVTTPRRSPHPTYVGYYDPDKKTPLDSKIEACIERFVAKRGAHPTVMLMHRDALVQATPRLDVAFLTAPFVPEHTFYAGREDVPRTAAPADEVTR